MRPSKFVTVWCAGLVGLTVVAATTAATSPQFRGGVPWLDTSEPSPAKPRPVELASGKRLKEPAAPKSNVSSLGRKGGARDDRQYAVDRAGRGVAVGSAAAPYESPEAASSRAPQSPDSRPLKVDQAPGAPSDGTVPSTPPAPDPVTAPEPKPEVPTADVPTADVPTADVPTPEDPTPEDPEPIESPEPTPVIDLEAPIPVSDAPGPLGPAGPLGSLGSLIG